MGLVPDWAKKGGGALLSANPLTAPLGQAVFADMAADQQGAAAAAARAEMDRRTGIANQGIQTGTNHAMAGMQNANRLATGQLQGLTSMGGQFLNQGAAMLGQSNVANPAAGFDFNSLRPGASQINPGAANAMASGNAFGGVQDLSRAGAFSGFEADPGFQFRQQQGEQAINRAAAAGGGRSSGRTMQALAQFNSGLASQEFGNFANRRMQLADRQQNLGQGLLAQGLGQGNLALAGQQAADTSAMNRNAAMQNLGGMQLGAMERNVNRQENRHNFNASNFLNLGQNFFSGSAALADQANQFGSQMGNLQTSNALAQANNTMGTANGNAASMMQGAGAGPMAFANAIGDMNNNASAFAMKFLTPGMFAGGEAAGGGFPSGFSTPVPQEFQSFQSPPTGGMDFSNFA